MVHQRENPEPKLIAITDVAHFGEARTLAAFERLCFAAQIGTVCVQLRWDSGARAQLRLGRLLQAICEASGQTLCINERLDVALALQVTAVHLKAASLAFGATQRLWQSRGLTLWASRAWHPYHESIPEPGQRLIVSPAMAERKGRTALGIAALARIAGDVAPRPVFALGGIGQENVRAVLDTGVAGVAAIGACYTDPIPLLRELSIIR